MTRAAAPKLGAYAGLCAAALLGALVLRRPELAAVAAPFAVALAAGLALAEPARVEVESIVAPERALEGDEIAVMVTVRTARPVERLELLVDVPRALVPVGPGPQPPPSGADRAPPRTPADSAARGGDDSVPIRAPAAVALRLSAGEVRRLELRFRAARWGGYRLGRVRLRARGPLGFHVEEGSAGEPVPLRVYPREETVRRLLAPLETQPATGSRVARAKGDGIEFADVRPFVSGDRVRRVNWRASARRGELWVNDTHPERNTDVVLFLDSFAEARAGGGGGTLDLAVRAAATLAREHLRRRDRVGLVGFGGVLRWLLPGAGPAHAYRIADALLDTEIVFSYAWKEVDVLPRRTLPPHALVLALSPLLDDRAVSALLDLRARGFDLAVVDVSPLPFVAPAAGAGGELGYRLWRLRRDALRYRYERAGVAVAEWRDGAPLQAAIEEVRSYRRHALRGRG